MLQASESTFGPGMLSWTICRWIFSRHTCSSGHVLTCVDAFDDWSGSVVDLEPELESLAKLGKGVGGDDEVLDALQSLQATRILTIQGFVITAREIVKVPGTTPQFRKGTVWFPECLWGSLGVQVPGNGLLDLKRNHEGGRLDQSRGLDLGRVDGFFAPCFAVLQQQFAKVLLEALRPDSGNGHRVQLPQLVSEKKHVPQLRCRSTVDGLDGVDRGCAGPRIGKDALHATDGLNEKLWAGLGAALLGSLASKRCASRSAPVAGAASLVAFPSGL